MKKDLLDSKEIIAVGEIDEHFFSKIIESLILLKDKKSITIYLNSPGGEVNLAVGIYDFIRSLSAEVTIIVLGEACSCASYILQAADHRLISESSVLMMHDWVCTIDDTATNAKTYISIGNKIFSKLVEVYIEKCGLTEKQFRSKLKNDWYLTAEEAVELGFADKIYGK